MNSLYGRFGMLDTFPDISILKMKYLWKLS
jgi:hypothetical protein